MQPFKTYNLNTVRTKPHFLSLSYLMSKICYNEDRIKINSLQGDLNSRIYWCYRFKKNCVLLIYTTTFSKSRKKNKNLTAAKVAVQNYFHTSSLENVQRVRSGDCPVFSLLTSSSQQKIINC